MLRISRAHMTAFSDAASRRFEERLISFFREKTPALCRSYNEHTLRDTIHVGVKRAEGYGLTTEYDVARYVNVVLVLGPNFDTDPRFPWAEAILNHETLDGRTKADMLAARTRFEDFDETHV